VTDTTYIVIDRDDGSELEIVATSAFEAAKKFVRRGDYQCDPWDCHTVTVRLRVREQDSDEEEYISIDVPPAEEEQ
jgi:hypothetical protein